MIADMEQLLGDYVKWLKDKTQLRSIRDSWVEITTPYLDRHNDCLQIYVQKKDDGYILTDDSYILNDLEMSGCELSSKRRQEILNTTLAGFGVQRQESALTVHASKNNFPQKKHALLQAMLAVNDLFYLATPQTASLFYEDMVRWLDAFDIRYSPRIKLPGKTGYDHVFDFVVPKSRKQPERLLQAITTPKRDAVESLFFKWIDTRELRPPDTMLVVMINDGESKPISGVLEALSSLDIKTFIWSERDKARDLLAA